MIDFYIKFNTVFKDSRLLKISLESEDDALILQEILNSDYGSFCGRGTVLTHEEVCVMED
jgi:hypothetical protein